MSHVAVMELEKEEVDIGKNFDYVIREPPCISLPPDTKTYWLVGRQTKEDLQEIKTMNPTKNM